MSQEQRAVALDHVLERVPAAYQLSTLRMADLGPSFPRFFHRQTRVSFNLVLGDTFERGLTELRQAESELEVARLMSPARTHEFEGRLESARDQVSSFQMTTCLVGDRLTNEQLAALGVSRSHLAPFSRPTSRAAALLRLSGIGECLAALKALNWRPPTELEWEFVAHVAHHGLDGLPAGRTVSNFLHLEGSPELCLDSGSSARALTFWARRGSVEDDHEALREEQLGLPPIVRRDLDELDWVFIRPWVALERAATSPPALGVEAAGCGRR